VVNIQMGHVDYDEQVSQLEAFKRRKTILQDQDAEPYVPDLTVQNYGEQSERHGSKQEKDRPDAVVYYQDHDLKVRSGGVHEIM